MTKAQWAHQVIWALKDLWVLRVTKDPQAMQLQKELKETKVFKVLLVLLAMLVLKVLKVLKDHKVE